jgi:hypothetical protein
LGIGLEINLEVEKVHRVIVNPNIFPTEAKLTQTLLIELQSGKEQSFDRVCWRVFNMLTGECFKTRTKTNG